MFVERDVEWASYSDCGIQLDVTVKKRLQGHGHPKSNLSIDGVKLESARSFGRSEQPKVESNIGVNDVDGTTTAQDSAKSTNFPQYSPLSIRSVLCTFYPK